MEASDKEYICSLEKDNGMHRCADLPPTKYEHVECTATVQEFFNYSNVPIESAALVDRPAGAPEAFRIDNRPQHLRQYASESTPGLSSEPNSFFASSLIASSAASTAAISTTSAAFRSSVVNDSMSSTDNFNAIFSMRANQTLNCINWNRYYTKCKAGDKNPFQGTQLIDL